MVASVTNCRKERIPTLVFSSEQDMLDGFFTLSYVEPLTISFLTYLFAFHHQTMAIS